MSPDSTTVPKIDMAKVQERMERIKSAHVSETYNVAIDKLSYLAASMEEQRDAYIEALAQSEKDRESSFKEGIKEGIRRFAWLQSGVEVVGPSGKPLTEALRAVDED